MTHKVKGFRGVNEADAFFSGISLPMDVGNLVFGFSTFSKSNLYIRNFSVHILL